MIKVVCVLKSGGEYTNEYVDKLRAGIQQHLKNFEFICLSDMKGTDYIKLESNLIGWWAKLEIFRITGKVLYLDLDTIITGDISEIANYPHTFTMLNDFTNPGIFASGVMAWDGDYKYIYDNFTFDNATLRKYRHMPRLGDGGYIQDQVTGIQGFQDIFPNQIMSHKVHQNREAARIVCYHGKPRPHTTNWEP